MKKYFFYLVEINKFICIKKSLDREFKVTSERGVTDKVKCRLNASHIWPCFSKCGSHTTGTKTT